MFSTCEVQVGNAIEYGTKSRATRIHAHDALHASRIVLSGLTDGGDFADVDDDDDVNYDEYEL